ncbi:hypothetical protein [Microvirga vignae]|nr:hypothetical protein [Microvirga vignae]
MVERLVRNSNEPGLVLILAWYNCHHGIPRGLLSWKPGDEPPAYGLALS